MADEWMMIGLEEKIARRQGLPPSIPVPKDEFPSIAEKGLAQDQVRKWLTKFLAGPGAAGGGWRRDNAALVARYDAFIAKGDQWAKAADAFQKNDMKKAIAALKMISAVDPNDHAAKMNLASALASSGDNAGALKQLEAIRASFEGDADYHCTCGHVRMAMQQRDEAIGEMVLALEAKPDCDPALKALQQLGVLVALYENPRDATSLTFVRNDSVKQWIEGVWDAEPRTGAYYLEQITYFESEKRHEVALAAAERGLALPDLDAKTKERLTLARVRALRATGRADEALAAAEAFVAERPDSAGGQVELARCLAGTRGDDAVAALDRALGIDPGDLEALNLRFMPVDSSDTEIAKAAEGIPKLQAWAESHPNVAGAWRSLARAKLMVHASEEAVDLLGKAVSLAPDDDDLRSEWWVELSRAGEFEKVLADAATLPDLGKRHWQLRWTEAAAYQSLGKKTEAYGAYAAINQDESLLVDIRKRAKRAASSVGGGGEG